MNICFNCLFLRCLFLKLHFHIFILTLQENKFTFFSFNLKFTHYDMNSSFKKNIFLLFSLFFAVLFISCMEEKLSTDSSLRLSFSTDSLRFDTLFSGVGSTTSKVLVYNRNSSALKISQISLAGAAGSSFHINVDGDRNADNLFKELEIGANDSLYIFVSVTVNVNTPPLVEDSLVFLTNGVHQAVHLQAYGQNVIVIKNCHITKDTTLTSEQPFLLMDSLVVNSGKTLTITPGCKFYCYNNARIVVKGNLNAQGTLATPIVMRGHRLDLVRFSTPFPYNRVAGQWGGVYLQGNSGNHVFNYVNMNSARVGIYLQNEDSTTFPTVKINNSRIHNCLINGLFMKNSSLTVVNSEISNSGSNTVYLNGGEHTFVHCTIANYFNAGDITNAKSREYKPAVMLMDLNKTAPMKSLFINCVIAGSYETEFSLASDDPLLYKGTFSHCYIRCPKIETAQFANIRWSLRNDTVFHHPSYDIEKNHYFDFSLDSVSPARGLADKTISVDLKYEFDLVGTSRMTDETPDAGAYEWKAKK